MELALTLIAFSGAVIVALITGLVAFLLRRNGQRKNNPNTVPERLCRSVELIIENLQALTHYLEGMENRAAQRHEASAAAIRDMFASAVKEVLDTLAPRRT